MGSRENVDNFHSNLYQVTDPQKGGQKEVVTMEAPPTSAAASLKRAVESVGPLRRAQQPWTQSDEELNLDLARKYFGFNRESKKEER